MMGIVPVITNKKPREALGTFAGFEINNDIKLCFQTGVLLKNIRAGSDIPPPMFTSLQYYGKAFWNFHS